MCDIGDGSLALLAETSFLAALDREMERQEKQGLND